MSVSAEKYDTIFPVSDCEYWPVIFLSRCQNITFLITLSTGTGHLFEFHIRDSSMKQRMYSAFPQEVDGEFLGFSFSYGCSVVNTSGKTMRMMMYSLPVKTQSR